MKIASGRSLIIAAKVSRLSSAQGAMSALSSDPVTVQPCFTSSGAGPCSAPTASIRANYRHRHRSRARTGRPRPPSRGHRDPSMVLGGEPSPLGDQGAPLPSRLFVGIPPVHGGHLRARAGRVHADAVVADL